MSMTCLLVLFESFLLFEFLFESSLEEERVEDRKKETERGERMIICVFGL